MKLRGGKTKPEVVPAKKTKNKNEDTEKAMSTMRISSSLPDISSANLEFQQFEQEINSSQYDQYEDEQELDKNFHDLTICDDLDDDEESTARPDQNSYEGEGTDDDECDELDQSDDDENGFNLMENNSEYVGQPLEILETTKKTKSGEYGKKLCYDGYYYTLDRDYVKTKNFNKCEWRCERTCTTKKWVKCTGRLISRGYNEPVLEINDHNHMPDPKKKEVLLHAMRLRYMAANTKDQPRLIMRSCSLDFPTSSALRLPEEGALLQQIKRVRSTKADYGSNALDLASIDVAEELRYTIDKEP